MDDGMGLEEPADPTRFLEIAALPRHSPVSVSHLHTVLSREPVHSWEASATTSKHQKQGRKHCQSVPGDWEFVVPHLGSQPVQ